MFAHHNSVRISILFHTYPKPRPFDSSKFIALILFAEKHDHKPTCAPCPSAVTSSCQSKHLLGRPVLEQSCVNRKYKNKYHYEERGALKHMSMEERLQEWDNLHSLQQKLWIVWGESNAELSVTECADTQGGATRVGRSQPRAHLHSGPLCPTKEESHLPESGEVNSPPCPGIEPRHSTVWRPSYLVANSQNNIT